MRQKIFPQYVDKAISTGVRRKPSRRRIENKIKIVFASAVFIFGLSSTVAQADRAADIEAIRNEMAHFDSKPPLQVRTLHELGTLSP